MARKAGQSKSTVSNCDLVLRVRRSSSVASSSRKRPRTEPCKRTRRHESYETIRENVDDERGEGSCSPELPVFGNASRENETRSPELPLQLRRTPNRRGVRSRRFGEHAAPMGQDDKTVKRLIPDYFPVRKSNRLFDFMEQLKAKEQNENRVIAAILSGQEFGFEVRQLPGKGRAVFTTRVFNKDEFVLEYAGTLRSLKEARQCEKLYSENQSLGCFMFYFKYLCKSYCIDATEETKRLGRLINHSRLKYNLVPKIITINGYPHLILIANRRIEIGEELLYDYGDRSRASLRAHPWLAT